jgi:DNA-damage-inducible protein D
MKQRLGVPKARALADFLPTVTIKAKDLATEMTNHTVRHTTIFGESSISAEHVKNNRNVRGALAQSGILPENLPPEDDIRKLERRVKSDERRLLRATKTLPKP